MVQVQNEVVNNNEVEPVAMITVPAPYNFQAVLAKQGVPYHAGVTPQRTNTADSPMQAWTDSISSPETDSEDMIVLTATQPEEAFFCSICSCPATV